MTASEGNKFSMESASAQDQKHPDPGGASGGERRAATASASEDVASAIFHAGPVRINVTGAFIVDTPGSTPHETSDIRLPNHTAVISHIAVDIGGTLAKVVYFTREGDLGGRLTFVLFETHRIDECIDFMKSLQMSQLALNGSQSSELTVMATGGGSFNYYDKIKDALGVNILREDEMECLIIGLDFFITEIPREVFTHSKADPEHFVEPRDDVYPYLLCNIGSGVSFLKVSGPREYTRVGGTSLGGGTLWGLLALLTGARTFDEMLALAERGDNSRVDMLVGDIYGAGYAKLGLDSNIIASSFGKVFRMKTEAEHEAEDSGEAAPHGLPARPGHSGRFAAPDMAVALLYAISNNIGQIAYLLSQIHAVTDIYFGGSFTRGHLQTIKTLTYAIDFWSGGTKQAYFLRHEGYLGAVGAFLKRQPPNWGRRPSMENVTAAKVKEGAKEA